MIKIITTSGKEYTASNLDFNESIRGVIKEYFDYIQTDCGKYVFINHIESIEQVEWKKKYQ